MAETTMAAAPEPAPAPSSLLTVTLFPPYDEPLPANNLPSPSTTGISDGNENMDSQDLNHRLTQVFETNLLEDIAVRYVRGVNALEELRRGLENELIDYFEKGFEKYQDIRIITISFLNHQFLQNILTAIFASKVDALYQVLKEIFVTSIPLTTREIEKLSSQKRISVEFGDIFEQYQNSSKDTRDANVLVNEYYSRFGCNRCLSPSCRSCRLFYAFFISRYWKFRDQSKDIYRRVAEDLFLKTYTILLSEKMPQLTSYSHLQNYLRSIRSGEGGLSALDIIEVYVLGKVTVEGRISPQLTAPTETSRGDFREYLLSLKLFESEFFHDALSPPEQPRTISTHVLDGGRQTRSRAPFLPPPPPHQYDKSGFENRLSGEEKNIIARIRNRSNVSQNLERLVENYFRTMSDLPGGVHSATTQTVLTMVEKLQMNSEDSCWIDIGCGAPLMALQGSIFNKITLALDLAPVMRVILQILSHMPFEQKALANSIYLQEGDILHLKKSDLPLEVAENVTHVTNFIGTDEANDATVRFVLANFLPTLKYLCVRGRYPRYLEEILEGYGFLRDCNSSFMMTLKSSSTHRRKRVTTYVKKNDGVIPLPDLNRIPIPKERVTVVVGLYRVLEINEETDSTTRSKYFRTQIADYHFHKVMYVASQQHHNSTLLYHPHSFFLARDFDYTHPIFNALRNFEIDCIETDFEDEDYFMEFYSRLAMCMMDGGRVIYLKSSKSINVTLKFASELMVNYSVTISSVGSASQYYVGMVQSESSLRELIPQYPTLSDLLKTKGDGTNEVIVLRRSDDLVVNQRSWKGFAEIFDLPVRRERKDRRITKEFPASPIVKKSISVTPQTPQSHLTDPESPATSEESEVLETPSPRRRKKRRRSNSKLEEAPSQPEVIDLTGDSLDYAKKLKRSLKKKGRLHLTIVGEDNIPFSCVIPPSDSESEGYDETRGPWSHLDADQYEI